MGYPVTDYVQAMSKACQTGFSAAGDLRVYKRVVMSGFVLAGLMFFFSLLTTKIMRDGGIGSGFSGMHLLQSRNYQTIEADTAKELIGQLRSHDLWQDSLPEMIPPVVLQRFPDDLDHLEVANKKKAFLHTLLPMALIALSEVAHERQQLQYILQKYSSPPASFAPAADGGTPKWAAPLNVKEQEFVSGLVEKYRTDSVEVLLRRVNTVPVSLIMAQGAIESSWGTSRFANQGNNLFGIWTWSGPGLVPTDRDADKSHMVATYETLLDSVRSYLLMLNRVDAYQELRVIRQRSNDPVALAAGLLNYSERGGIYVSDIGRVIEHNNLRDYDAMALTGDLNPSRMALLQSPADGGAHSFFGLGRIFTN